MVVADGDRQLAQAKADELASMLWERRERYLVKKTPLNDVIEYAAGQRQETGGSHRLGRQRVGRWLWRRQHVAAGSARGALLRHRLC